jgi:hypothetical protein
MATRIQIILIDDLDGAEATETITFALSGVDYEIDLNEGNAFELRVAIGLYANRARRVSGRKRTGTPARGTGSDTKKIRAWAEAQGDCPRFC